MLPPDLTGISTGLQERMIEFKGHLQEASKLFSEMLKKGISPSTVAFNTMIHICGSYGYLEEYSQPTVIRMYIDLGMLTRACVWFERFHLAGGMSYICYAANIDA